MFTNNNFDIKSENSISDEISDPANSLNLFLNIM